MPTGKRKIPESEETAEKISATPRVSKSPGTKRETVADLKKKLDEALEKIDSYSKPVQKDFKFLWFRKPWVKWVLIGLGVLLLGYFGYNAWNKKQVSKEQKKVEVLHQRDSAVDNSVRNLEYENSVYRDAFEKLRDADLSSGESSKRVSVRGEKKRFDAKIIKDEIDRKIKDPDFTDTDRDAVTEQLFRSREAVKVRNDH